MNERGLKYQVFWIFVMVCTIVGAIYSTIVSLTHGIFDVFPFLYFLPIIIFVYLYPHRGIIFSVLLSAIYMSLVYFYGLSDPRLIAVSTAWFVIFVTIGVVTSSFAVGVREGERKYQRIFENSQAGIFTFDCRTLLIKEMNEKCAQMLNFESKDLLERELTMILPESAERDHFLSQLRSKSLSGEMELIFHARDGAMRPFATQVKIAVR